MLLDDEKLQCDKAKVDLEKNHGDGGNQLETNIPNIVVEGDKNMKFIHRLANSHHHK